MSEPPQYLIAYTHLKLFLPWRQNAASREKLLVSNLKLYSLDFNITEVLRFSIERHGNTVK